MRTNPHSGSSHDTVSVLLFCSVFSVFVGFPIEEIDWTKEPGYRYLEVEKTVVQHTGRAVYAVNAVNPACGK